LWSFARPARKFLNRKAPVSVPIVAGTKTPAGLQDLRHPRTFRRMSKPTRKPLLIAGLLGVVFLFAAWTEANRPVRGPHGRLALSLFRAVSDTLPVLQSTYFWTSGRCAGCHGRDLLGQASIDPATGHDVNVVDDWRSTLMANSARDPFFRAKLDHEILVNPAHGDAISTKCLSCHAPLAVFEEALSGRPPFTHAMPGLPHAERAEHGRLLQW
jgi:hypothetical protein